MKNDSMYSSLDNQPSDNIHMSKQQIERENQVLNPSELTIGLMIESFHKEKSWGLLVVVSEPYPYERTMWIDLLEVESGDIRRHSLADDSVIPYEDGSWNNSNYFINTGKTVQVQTLISVEVTDGKNKTIYGCQEVPLTPDLLDLLRAP